VRRVGLGRDQVSATGILGAWDRFEDLICQSASDWDPHPAARPRHGRPIHAAGAMQLELIQGGMADSTSGNAKVHRAPLLMEQILITSIKWHSGPLSDGDYALIVHG
jgi:hypothetical protein